MAKVNYRSCDICGSTLNTDVRIRGYLNGARLFNRLFRQIDICNTCLDKLKHLSTDKEIECKCMEKAIMRSKKYDDFNHRSIYLKGVEDALTFLSHNQLRNQ